MKDEHLTGTDNAVLEEILKFAKGIQYGEITITLHDFMIVQIERKEKKRFGKGVMLFKNNCKK
jgi:hypothetical protein